MNTFTMQISDILEESGHFEETIYPLVYDLDCWFSTNGHEADYSVGLGADYQIDDIFINGKSVNLDNMKEWFKDLIRWSIKRDCGEYVWTDWSINDVKERK